MMDMYILEIIRITLHPDILPKATISPRGRENKRVSTNISTVIRKPSDSWAHMVSKLMKSTP